MTTLLRICNILSLSTPVYPNGTVAEKYSYNAWGRRRNPANWADYNVKTPRLLNRGYTGHEMLDAFGLINMNGRMYDPVIGRILSPDPFVSTPSYTQGYNRYSYCLNNPLRYTDPSGYFQVPIYNWNYQDLSERGSGGGSSIILGYMGLPGSENHWSDAVRSEYGNYMVMSSNTFDTRYGDGASAIAGQLMSDPAAFTQWQKGLTSVDKIQEAGGFWSQQAYTSKYSGPGSITLNGVDYKIQPATGGVANKWISVNGEKSVDKNVSSTFDNVSFGMGIASLMYQTATRDLTTTTSILASEIQAAEIIGGVARVAKYTGWVGNTVYLGVNYTNAYLNKNNTNASYYNAKAVGATLIFTLNAINFVVPTLGTVLSIGAGIIDANGGFDFIYNRYKN